MQTGTDLADAMPTVAQLLGVNGSDNVTVELEIRTDSHAAPRYFGWTSFARVQMEYLLPLGFAESVESLLEVERRNGVRSDEGVDLWVEPADVAALQRLSELPPVPVSVHLLEIAPGDLDWELLPHLGGPERAVVSWTDGWWRPVPEAGLVGDSKHAGFALSINSTDVWAFTPALGTFHLSIETREGAEGDRLSEWIAEQIGRQVLTS